MLQYKTSKKARNFLANVDFLINIESIFLKEILAFIPKINKKNVNFAMSSQIKCQIIKFYLFVNFPFVLGNRCERKREIKNIFFI